VATAARANPKFALLAGLGDPATAEVLGRGRDLHVAKKVRLCTEGSKAGQLFLLRSGRIKYGRSTATGRQTIIRLFTAGESFGFAALLPEPLHYLGTAEAMCPSEVSVWSHAQISQLSDRYPMIRTNALQIALRVLGTLSDRHSMLFEGDATHRIAKALIDVARRSGEVGEQGIDVRITTEDLGSLADASRFTVSRVLSQWNKNGAVTKQRERVCIHSPEALISN